MATDQLERFREAVDDDAGEEVAEMCRRLAKKGYQLGAIDELKTAPTRATPKDHPRIEILRRKGLTAFRSWEPGAVAAHQGGREEGRDGWKDAGELNAGSTPRRAEHAAAARDWVADAPAPCRCRLVSWRGARGCGTRTGCRRSAGAARV